MRKITKKIMVIALLLITMFTNKSNIQAQSFINNNGLEFTEEKYNFFLGIGFSEKSIEEMDISTYDAYSDVNEIKIEKTYDIFVRDTTIIDPYTQEQRVYSEQISEYEYENEIDSIRKVVRRAGLIPSITHETTYKKLTVNVLDASTATYRNRKIVSSNLYWKKVPKIKSYDIFAARLENGEIFKNSENGQMTSVEHEFDENCGIPGTEEHTTQFKPGAAGWNMQKGKITYTGLGFTAQLKEHSSVCKTDLGPIFSKATSYKASLNFMAYQGTKVFVSYQHAAKEVSLSSVQKKYTFSNSGLGNVIYFSDTSIRDSYDAMKGVSITL